MVRFHNYGLCPHGVFCSQFQLLGRILIMGMPSKYIRLASIWHSGQDDLLYAIASSGGLKRGTMRPINEDTGLPCNNLEWKLQLYNGLTSDIRYAMRQLEKQPDSKNSKRWLPRFQKFLDWTNRQIARMENKLESRRAKPSEPQY